MRPTLSIIIPTIGRPSLADTLGSIRVGMSADPNEVLFTREVRYTRDGPIRTIHSDVEIIVVGDTHGDTYTAALDDAPVLCERYGARYLEHDGGQHMVGQPQREHGMRRARGRWLAWGQDDDVYEPGAIGAILRSIEDGEPCPRLFRCVPRGGFTVWQAKGLALGNIDANCIVTPNDPARLGRWALKYDGDYDFIRETADLWGGNVRWVDRLISRRVG